MKENGKIMVNSWELDGLSKADRFFNLALAYLECSHFLFKSIIDRSIKTTFSHAQSAGFLFEHSLELFLKGVITEAGRKPKNTHDLSKLYQEFKKLFPGDKSSFKGKIEEVCTKDAQRPYSEYNRYPIDRSGKLWSKPSFYDPNLWASQLNLFIEDYKSIMSRIKRANS